MKGKAVKIFFEWPDGEENDSLTIKIASSEPLNKKKIRILLDAQITLALEAERRAIEKAGSAAGFRQKFYLRAQKSLVINHH